MNSLLSKKELRDALKQETSLFPSGPFISLDIDPDIRVPIRNPDPLTKINPIPKHCSQYKKTTLTVPL